MTPAGTTTAVSDDFLKFASEAINNTDSTEGVLRSAISRAYYAVFLLARDQLFGTDGAELKKHIRKQLRKEFKKISKKDPGSHQQIIFAVSQKAITLSQQMSQLHEARINADYFFSAEKLRHLPHKDWQAYAKETVELAQLLQKEAANLPRF